MSHDASASLAQRNAMQKQKMKIYADRWENAQEINITPGEIVLMKQNKLSTPSNPKPFCCGGDKTINDHSEKSIRDCKQKLVQF